MLLTYGGTEYKYNAQGVRFEKKQKGYTKRYYFDGGRVLGEDWYDAKSNVKLKLRYFYDAEGIAGVQMNSTSGPNYNTYYLVRDTQGNVTRILDSSGKVVNTYIYDAWGYVIKGRTNPGSDTFKVEDVNPFRWKGYYYDEETELYEIYTGGRTRFYSPELMMFLDAESPMAVLQNCTEVNGLNRNSLGVMNPLQFPVNGDNIFTSLPLFSVETGTTENNSAGSGCSGNGFTLPDWLKWTIGGAVIGVSWLSVPFTKGKTLPIAVGATVGGLAGLFTGALSEKGDEASGFMTGSLLGAAVGGVFVMGKEAVISGLFAVGDKVVADLLAFATYGKPIPLFNEFRWEDYAVTFALGRYKLPGLLGLLGSPAVGRLVKMGTRGESWDGRGYLFDVGMSIITDKLPKSLKPTIKGFGSGYYYSITK